MAESDVFHFGDGAENFETLSHENGDTYWHARTLMGALNYQSWPSFNKAIQRAISSCVTLGIDIQENFRQERRDENGHEVDDYRLTRFACYLVAMNGDTKKPEVAKAQAYFAALAETFRRYVEEAEEFDRLLEREEITQSEKLLSAAAKAAGVDKFPFFQNAGYRGMYNMNLKRLKEVKGVPEKRSALDFMGHAELAANRFRITQTELKLKNDGIQGQQAAERAAEGVGRKVRETMQEISGTSPEELPPSGDIKKVRSAIKSSQKDFKKLDKTK